MLKPLWDTVVSIIGAETIDGLIEYFGAENLLVPMIMMTCCILIILTVTFVFKFILKLVDR